MNDRDKFLTIGGGLFLLFLLARGTGQQQAPGSPVATQVTASSSACGCNGVSSSSPVVQQQQPQQAQQQPQQAPSNWLNDAIKPFTDAIAAAVKAGNMDRAWQLAQQRDALLRGYGL